LALTELEKALVDKKKASKIRIFIYKPL